MGITDPAPVSQLKSVSQASSKVEIVYFFLFLHISLSLIKLPCQDASLVRWFNVVQFGRFFDETSIDSFSTVRNHLSAVVKNFAIPYSSRLLLLVAGNFVGTSLFLVSQLCQFTSTIRRGVFRGHVPTTLLLWPNLLNFLLTFVLIGFFG